MTTKDFEYPQEPKGPSTLSGNEFGPETQDVLAVGPETVPSFGDAEEEENNTDIVAVLNKIFGNEEGPLQENTPSDPVDPFVASLDELRFEMLINSGSPYVEQQFTLFLANLYDQMTNRRADEDVSFELDWEPGEDLKEAIEDLDIFPPWYAVSQLVIQQDNSSEEDVQYCVRISNNDYFYCFVANYLYKQNIASEEVLSAASDIDQLYNIILSYWVPLEEQERFSNMSMQGASKELNRVRDNIEDINNEVIDCFLDATLCYLWNSIKRKDLAYNADDYKLGGVVGSMTIPVIYYSNKFYNDLLPRRNKLAASTIFIKARMGKSGYDPKREGELEELFITLAQEKWEDMKQSIHDQAGNKKITLLGREYNGSEEDFLFLSWALSVPEQDLRVLFGECIKSSHYIQGINKREASE